MKSTSRWMVGMTFGLAVMFLASSADAQGMRWGIRGGWNFDSVSDINTSSVEDTFDASTGYNFGVFADVSLGPIGVRPGITYMNTGSLFEGASFLDAVDDFDLSYVVIPVDFKYGLGMPMANPFLSTGPEFRLLASAGDAPTDLEDQFDSFGMTWGVGFGFELGAPGAGVKFVPEFHYSFDVSGILDKEFEVGGTTITTDGSQKLNGARLSLGVIF